MNIPNITTKGTFIHYAVEAYSTDGRFVICLTQSLEVAIAALKTRAYPITEDGSVYIQGQIIPFSADQEVWLGFEFYHRGAKRAVAELGNYSDNTQEVVLSKEDYWEILNKIRVEERKIFEYPEE